MKKILWLFLLNGFFFAANAQKISKLTLSQTGEIKSMYVLIDDNVTIDLSPEGSITGFGVEVFSDRSTQLSKLDKYPGRVDYYTNYDNEAFRGKVKYIGRTPITYYGTYDNEAFRGKVKTIGTTYIEYYSNFEDEFLKGKIKSMGSETFTWYTSFDNEAFRGKVKSIGITNFNYFASFDDKAYKGKIKSIGNASFTYYSSIEKREYAGMIKSGNYNQIINGIKIYIN